eukprot:2964879-Rhodomonas_salina.1
MDLPTVSETVAMAAVTDATRTWACWRIVAEECRAERMSTSSGAGWNVTPTCPPHRHRFVSSSASAAS